MTALILATAQGQAQDTTWNHVRNGGFEQVTKVPYTFDQFSVADGWKNITIGLSELFDSTATPKTVGLPVNEYGTVKPSEGARCAGFFAWKDDMRRNWDGGSEDPFMKGWSAYSEYLMTQLSEPLKEGRTYAISMDVMLAGNSDRAVSGIGAYCSPVPLRYEHRRFLEEKAQVATEDILAERGKWVRITGTFEADGGEQYLILGVFPYVGWDQKRIVEGLDNQYAYYYVDNVSLKVAPPEE
jgi:hypothetical protein